MANPLANLLEVAAPQRGLFTVSQARTVGVGDVQVRKMAARGALERRAQGVYRIPTVPIDDHTELMEAVLWAKGRGVIAGATALALWDLADVNPRKIDLMVPANYNPRRQDGALYAVRRGHLTDGERDEADGIPTVTPSLAIHQAIAHGVAGDMIEQAIGKAQARDLIGTETAARLRVALYDRNTRAHGTKKAART